ncbi:class I SAM-dependent methyltransferase [Floridanema aerugineum]|jgi:trans-aconitate 2-methyltransferase|uniref:Trans-aconitate 2-methyltransferase n=1 Tax=Floridaenema aerugineum BLCC-F46 TaxID=3153654 RepID=A0ABV4X5Z1_9CYAN
MSENSAFTRDNEVFPGEVFPNPADFDQLIRQLLRKYDEMLDVLVKCIPANVDRILELGCGTGELSLKLLNRFPTVQIIAVDYSPRMLQYAQEKIRVAGYQQRWIAKEADFGEWANNSQTANIGNNFDACVSSLAIHHLTDEMKLKLFQQIRHSLNPGGVFWNADPILPESELMKTVYQTAREEWAIEQGSTLTEIRSQVGKSVPYGYSSPDRLATLEAQLQMLKTSGFDRVAVPWKYYNLAVFGGN